MNPDDHCHEDMGADPCGKPPVGYRIDERDGDPYPVCLRHIRPPYWLTARAEQRQSSEAARAALRLAEQWDAEADHLAEPHAEVYGRHADALLNALSPIVLPTIEDAGVVSFPAHRED